MDELKLNCIGVQHAQSPRGFQRRSDAQGNDCDGVARVQHGRMSLDFEDEDTLPGVADVERGASFEDVEPMGWCS